MAAMPRYRPQTGFALLAAGFRPFFLLAALWACAAIPISVAFFAGFGQIPAALAPGVWHAHEMTFGFGAAAVAGFLLTAIPNWTGRMPLQGKGLALLALLWIAGRFAFLFLAEIGGGIAAVLDLALPCVFLAAIAREVIGGRNWRNLPMLGALAFLLTGNLLVHLESLGVARTAETGNRLGVATLLMLISLIGGRIIPSFTRNWLAKHRPATSMPALFNVADRVALSVTVLALAIWVFMPEAAAAPWFELAAGIALGIRLVRWRFAVVLREPLLWVLHLGYAWLAFGFLLLAVDSFEAMLPHTTALHALTTGAIGTMILAVMTRASLGHTGRPLVAGPGTTVIYVFVTLAAILRLLAPLAGAHYIAALSCAGAAWSAAFGLFVLLYGRLLLSPRVT
jgi:uncharacterized protein involved in response to NO